MKKTYDQKCYDLANAFLSDWDGERTELQTADLASTIQQATEAWLEESGFAP